MRHLMEREFGSLRVIGIVPGRWVSDGRKRLTRVRLERTTNRFDDRNDESEDGWVGGREGGPRLSSRPSIPRVTIRGLVT